MLQIIPQDVVLERLDQLPFELKERLLSPEFGSLVREICSLHHLDDRKADFVLVLAGDVLFGFSYLQDFPRALVQELSLDQRLALILTQEIHEKFFAPVEEEIKKHYKPYVEPLVSPSLKELGEAGRKLPIALESAQRGEQLSPVQKEEGEQQKNRIVINPALLRMQRDEETRYRKQETNTDNDLGASKPFVLFEQRGAEALRQAQGIKKKGFSMPFGFFKGSASTSAGVSKSGEPVRAEVKSVGEAPAPQKPRVVHYSGERTQVTPFAKEENIFRVLDTKNVTMTDDHDDDNNTRTMTNDNDNGIDGKRMDVKPVVEKPGADGEVRVRTNPFSFPGSQRNTKPDGKPKVEGNVVNLR